jgi:V/A-type H+-transporting ATPase subunit I
MIVPMKKAVVVTQSKDSLDALNKLRSSGVLHVRHEQPPKGRDITTLHEEIALFNQALSILSGIKSAAKEASGRKEGFDGKFICRHIIDLYKRKEQLTEYLRSLSALIKQYEEWGDFDPREFTDLAGKNIFAGLYQIPLKQLKQLGNDIAVSKLSGKGGIANCLLVSAKKIDIGLKEIPLPRIGLSGMRRRCSQDGQVVRGIEEQLIGHLDYQPGLNRIKAGIEKELEFQEALSGMGQAEELSYISGYIPFDSVEKLTRQAKQEQWALIIDEPGLEENPPVLLRNPAWISVIKPVFKFLEILPGYHELDISLAFLIFFSIFFGILIGDAGYGLVYCLITFFLHQRARKNKQKTSGFFLFYILSFCAIIWGISTGTFFGQEWVLKAGYKPLIPALNDEKALQRLCFFIGALHLSIAHIWRAILKSPALTALADIGWTCVLWACFFIARVLILGDNFPSFGNWLIIAGISLVVIFTSPQKNILKGIGQGLGTLALSLMNNFTDVVSYIRLFAVGLAGIAISDAFNAMALSAGIHGIFNLVLAGFILLVGHTLGIILGPVAVLVHGIRLNVLEFSGHANVSWSGQNYKPLKD